MHVLLPLPESNDLVSYLLIVSYKHSVLLPQRVGLFDQAQNAILHLLLHLLVEAVEVGVDDDHFSQVEGSH